MAFIGLWASGLFDQQVDYDSLYEPYPYLLNLRNAEDSGIQEAIDAYVSEDFDLAYASFSAMSTDSLSNELVFYRAISAMSVGNFQKALADFELIGHGTDNAYYQQTLWYKALTHWQLGDHENALNALKRIPPGDFKYEESQKLISQLD